MTSRTSSVGELVESQQPLHEGEFVWEAGVVSPAVTQGHRSVQMAVLNSAGE